MMSYSLPDGGHVALTYNARAVTSVSRLNGDKELLYSHAYTGFDEVGNVTEERLIGNGGTVSFTFDALYQLKSIQHAQFSQKNLLYDPVGNLLSYEKNGEHFSFGYDDLYQLTKENNHRYTYDPFYNRKSKDEEQYEVDELNQLLSRSDITYSYDLNGNLLQLEDSNQKLVFTYDPLNRLTSIEKGEEKVVFTYDAFHRRLTRNGTPFHFCREQEIGFKDSLRILGPGLGADIGAAVAIELEGVTYAPLHDHQGSIIGLLDLEGHLVSAWSYTAYGELVGEAFSPWGFCSKRQEPLTGWISFGRRDYDPVTGRWTTPDPLGYEAGPNLYTYVYNRPLTHRDPLGLAPDDAELEANIYTYEDSWWEPIKDWAFKAFTGIIEGITLAEDYAFEYGYQDKAYNEEMFVYELCDLKNLPPGSVVHIKVNGIGVSAAELKESAQFLADQGYNVVAIYNPSHGKGLENFSNDLFRAYAGIKGYISPKREKDFEKAIDSIFAKAPQNIRFLLEAHSEGNILAVNYLEKRGAPSSHDMAYLALSPATFLRAGILEEGKYLAIYASNDLVANQSAVEKLQVSPSSVFIAKSSSLRKGLDHAENTATLFPYKKIARDNLIKHNKLFIR